MDLIRDPQESDPELGKLIRRAEREALAELKDLPRFEGFCHQLWARQKQILKEKHGMTWKSPAEMNPNVLFD